MIRCSECHKLVKREKTDLKLYKRKGKMAIYRPACHKCLGYTGNIFDSLKNK